MGRSATIKNLDEAFFYAVNESTSLHFAQLVVTTPGNINIVQKDAYDATNTGDLVIFAKYGLGAASGTISVGNATGDTVDFAAGLAPNLGTVVKHPEAATGSADYFTMALGTATDSYEVYLVPSFGSADEIEWIDDFSADAVEMKRDIKLKGYTNHRKRIFELEKKISITQKYANASKDLLEFSGNPYSLIAETQDDAAGLVTETALMFGCYHDAGMPSGSVGDQDSSIALDISYEDWCSIAGAVDD